MVYIYEAGFLFIIMRHQSYLVYEARSTRNHLPCNDFGPCILYTIEMPVVWYNGLLSTSMYVNSNVNDESVWHLAGILITELNTIQNNFVSWKAKKYIRGYTHSFFLRFVRIISMQSNRRLRAQALKRQLNKRSFVPSTIQIHITSTLR